MVVLRTTVSVFSECPSTQILGKQSIMLKHKREKEKKTKGGDIDDDFMKLLRTGRSKLRGDWETAVLHKSDIFVTLKTKIKEINNTTETRCHKGVLC